MFPFLDPRAAAELAERLQVERYRVGQVVWRAGDAAHSLYLVASGRARVVGGAAEAEISLAVLAPGDVFGEEALLSRGPRAYTVRAAEELVLLRLGREALQELIRRRPELEAGSSATSRTSPPATLGGSLRPLSRSRRRRRPSPRPGARTPRRSRTHPLPRRTQFRPRRGRRWPVVYQIGEMDCGAACLVMIGQLLRPRYRLQTMRELARGGTGRRHAARAGGGGGEDRLPRAAGAGGAERSAPHDPAGDRALGRQPLRRGLPCRPPRHPGGGPRPRPPPLSRGGVHGALDRPGAAAGARGPLDPLRGVAGAPAALPAPRLAAPARAAGGAGLLGALLQIVRAGVAALHPGDRRPRGGPPRRRNVEPDAGRDGDRAGVRGAHRRCRATAARSTPSAGSTSRWECSSWRTSCGCPIATSSGPASARSSPASARREHPPAPDQGTPSPLCSTC